MPTENTYPSGGVLSSLYRFPKKRKGAFLSLETLMYIVVLLILLAIGLGLFSQRESAKVSTARSELDQIRNATIEYNSYQITSQFPSDPSVLLDALPATETMDGLEHGPFLQPNDRWKDGALKDPWGGTYTYVGSGQNVTAIQTDGGGHLKTALSLPITNSK